MNIYQILLKAIRKLIMFCNNENPYTGYLKVAEFGFDADHTSVIITKAINIGTPLMIARYGAFELSTVLNYLGVYYKKSSFLKYIQGKQGAPFWEETVLRFMESNAGFFPATHENAKRFGELMLQDTKQLDILAEWKSSFHLIEDLLPANCIVSHLANVEPFFAKHPWTKALTGKKVLVVHPFNELIELQYNDSREKLFANPEMLPEFELKTIKAVQSMGGEPNGFKDWFEALEWMKKEIDKVDYDVCLLGCGAYGFPLAAHCKRMGKQAIHLGGSLQLLFGIIGNRWADPNYGVNEWGIVQGQYSNMINEYWARPSQNERPKNAYKVEGACYW